MNSELLFEKKSYVDRSVLIFLSLIEFVNPKNKTHQVLIGNKDWLLNQVSNTKKKFVCICVDGKIKNSSNVLNLTTYD